MIFLKGIAFHIHLISNEMRIMDSNTFTCVTFVTGPILKRSFVICEVTFAYDFIIKSLQQNFICMLYFINVIHTTVFLVFTCRLRSCNLFGEIKDTL